MEYNLPNDWEVITLEEIVEQDAPIRYGVVQIGPDTDGGVPIVPIKYMNRIASSVLHKADPEIEKKYRASRIKEGDVLLSVKATIGMVGVVPKGFKGNIAREIARIRTNSDHNPRFIAMQLQAEHTQREIFRLTVGTTRKEFSIHAVRKFPIMVPKNINDQDKIVNFISRWNLAIEKTEKLISAKQKQFDWLKQELFDNDFKNYKDKLSFYASTLQQEKISIVGSLKPLTVKLHCKGIVANERDIQITLSKKGRPYFQRFAGDFIIGRQNFHNGGFGIVPKELNGFIASNAITTLDINKEKLDSYYLFYFLSRKNYYLRVGNIMGGTGQKELSEKEIIKLPVSFPGIEKQREVVQKLSKAQEEIKLLEKTLEKYKEQKKGLMQKLLSGTWRVKV